ncbi:MAG: sensor histidine kinase [Actinomycetota bacterium]|nr:sensor histidine kinase [Actinomycetota bacterium]
MSSRARMPSGRRLPGGTHAARRNLSLLPKILVALLVALALGSVATVVLETRLARAALREQARDMLQSELDALQAGFVEQQTVLEKGLRSAAQKLALHDRNIPGRQSELVTEVSRVQRDLGLDSLTVLTDRGETVVSLGVPIVAPPPDALPGLSRGSARPLLRTTGGDYVQTSVVPVRARPERLLLVGGTLFGSAAAYRLRGLVGHDVILVADGAVAGATLGRPITDPPGFGGARPERPPSALTLDGTEAYVDYVSVAHASQPWEASGWIGLVVPEPVAALDRSLTRNRLVGIFLLGFVALGVAWVLFRHLTRPLKDLVAVARRIAVGNLDAPFAVEARDEVGELAEALERMRRAIRNQVDVISQQSQALRASSERMVNAEEEERRRLANVLHDGIQRELVMLRMRLASARREINRHPEQIEAIWSELVCEVDAVVESVRHTSHHIYPAILQDQGLGPALHSLAGRSPVSLRVRLQPDPLPRLSRSVEASAYFLVSEAVTNALKHGRASNLHVTVRFDENAQVLFTGVSDNGYGFDASAVSGCDFLVHLRDRVEALGGHLDIRSAPGQGSEVEACLPVDVTPARPAAASNGGAASTRRGQLRTARGVRVNRVNVAGRTAPPRPSGSNLSPR